MRTKRWMKKEEKKEDSWLIRGHGREEVRKRIKSRKRGKIRRPSIKI